MSCEFWPMMLYPHWLIWYVWVAGRKSVFWIGRLLRSWSSFQSCSPCFTSQFGRNGRVFYSSLCEFFLLVSWTNCLYGLWWRIKKRHKNLFEWLLWWSHWTQTGDFLCLLISFSVQYYLEHTYLLFNCLFYVLKNEMLLL